MTRPQRIARTALALALLAGVALAAFLLSHAVPRSMGAWLPPCRTEDSTGCYWSADLQGNGTGQSYVTIGDTPIYLDVMSRPIYNRLPSTL